MIENIVNKRVKKVLHFLFLIATFLSCRVCVVYLSNAEKNFDCPICIFIKGVYSSANTIVTVGYPDRSVLENVTINQKYNGGNEKNIRSEIPDFISFNSILITKIVTPIQKTRLTHSHIAIKRHLYVLFSQLRIGDYSHVKSTMNQY